MSACAPSTFLRACLLAATALLVATPVGSAAGVPTVHAAATTEARALADAAAMTSTARSLYLATRPTIDDRATFAAHCPALETSATYLLGCYRAGGGRIHLLRIERPELATGMVVTAAHEMLHAAYASLTGAERRRIDALTAKTFAALDDLRLEQEVSAYPRREVAGELHSRLGTEVAALPPALERHYRRYFRDRGLVVLAAGAYQRVFDDLESQVAQVEDDIERTVLQLEELRPRVSAATAEADRLTAEIEELRSTGRVAESNALVEPQNAAVAAANIVTNEYNAIVALHNQLVDSYNKLLLANQELLASLAPLAPAR